VAAGAWGAWTFATREARPAPAVAPRPSGTDGASGPEAGTVEPEPVGPLSATLTAAQQEAIGLETVAARAGNLPETFRAPGQVVPDENRFAYITARAAGVVRSVSAHVGQRVKAGDLLATIDSPEVAEARLALVSRLQELEIARATAERQGLVYEATTDLIAHLRKGETPSRIDEALEGRPIGENRQRLMTAYADYRLADAMFDRSQALREGDAVSLEKFQQARAEYEGALSKFLALLEGIEFEARIDHARAQQALRQAETSVRVARERLRVLGVRPDGTEPEVRGGRVVGVRPDGGLPETAELGKPVTEMTPEEILPDKPSEVGPAAPGVKPVGSEASRAEEQEGEHSSLSTYSIWAPFDGTVLERELVVPGVFVDTTHRIFQVADLSKVWVEVKVQESDFGKLHGTAQGRLRFTSPAYPGQDFEARVIYSGDLVDPKTRAILLLAEADNPDGRLKPGMFVDVEVVGPYGRPAVFVPESALLSRGEDRFVYVRVGPDQFERRYVEVGDRLDGEAAVVGGLEPGEPVVTEGVFKLKAVAEEDGEAD
jgi:multidrug efflux pump subunit AcrA (membrane-fusion protein)